LWFKGDTDTPTDTSWNLIKIGEISSNTIRWDKDNESLDLNKNGGYFKIRAIWDGDPIPTTKIADFDIDVIDAISGSTLTGPLTISDTTNEGNALFTVEGTNGILFQIKDDLSDSLLSINNISGLPVL